MKRIVAGIAIVGRHDVGAECVADLRIVIERIEEGEANGCAGQDRMIKPVGNPLHHRGVERVVFEHGGMNERGELRLLPHHRLGFAANTRPDRVDGIEGHNPLRLGH